MATKTGVDEYDTHAILRLSDASEEPLRLLLPIEGYEKLPLVSLEIATESIVSLLPSIKHYAYVAKQRCENPPADGLTPDESASIMLYTMEWPSFEQSFYHSLNATLRSTNRQKLRPWLAYLKLFLTGLSRLPPIRQVVYRGTKLDLSNQYHTGATIIWWGFSSCVDSLQILQSEHFLGKTAMGTIFVIECYSGKNIRKHSYFTHENEILLLPATQFKVMSSLNVKAGLHIIYLKEEQPHFTLLELPFISSNSSASFLNSETEKKAQSSLSMTQPTPKDIGNVSSNKINHPTTKISKSIYSDVEQITLTSIRFVLLNLSMHLSPLASNMLDALRSLAKDSILVIDSSSTIDFGNLHNTAFILFTTSQVISLMKQKPEQLTKIRLLESDKNMVDQQERFSSSKNLIFQLADDLCRYYKLEANDDLKAGNTSSAKQKEELASRIHSEMKNVHKTFAANNTANKLPIVTKTTLVFLKPKLHHDINMKDVQNLLNDIMSSFLTFDNEESCYDHVQRNEVENAVFIIIDTDYKNSVAARFQKLANVKNVYRYDQSSSMNEMNITNHEDLCFELIHDLIIHYNKLAAEYDARKDSENAKNMYLTAHKLSKLLAEF